MAIVVQKYGGTSVASTERILRAARRVAWKRSQGYDVVVVVSAMGDTTDSLIALAEAINGDAHPSPREMDMLMATGEQVSAALMAMALQRLGVPAVSLTGFQAGFFTDDTHRAARILDVKPDRVRKELEAGRVVVVTGFQGIDAAGDLTTLGRGGSDLTAIALAAALDAEACQIYTDVDGIYTADPRIVPNARRLEEISYEELLEMSSSGAQVMQLRSVEFARQYGVEFEVLSSLSPLPDEGGTEEKKTKVVARVNPQFQRVVTGVAVNSKVARITLLEVPDRPGIAAKLFSAFARNKIVIDDIVQSGGPGATQADISLTVAKDDLDVSLDICREVMQEWPGTQLVYDVDVAKVSIVGSGVASNYGVAATMFTALAERGINIEMITGSEISISCLVRASRAAEAVQAIHEKFGLGDGDQPVAIGTRGGEDAKAGQK
ncbi:aspartate kinase [Caldinitratiruptor microaerophilus]|uniref:Aspartokinase n=1 Tax=Caldinitratiruptor microaerophilus TaxID=671077 RepID=A0AA35CJ84_9FIRM|nr:aspartate kinase [Caldinitratiruptor microaerophilus]BDG60097.1 aspartokinase [Caldinitratiruptor microaerophilus]